MNKVILGEEAKEKLITGVITLAAAVSCTLGPKGRNVVIQKPGKIHITKDGVTVAQHVRIDDPVEAIGANMVREVASQVGKEAGDGTTTATVIASYLIVKGMELIKNGASPIEIKLNMEAAAGTVIGFIKKNAIQIEDDLSALEKIATISANNDKEIGHLIHLAFKQIGKTGFIRILESNDHNSYVKTVPGIEIKQGYLSQHFCNTPGRTEVIFSNGAYIVIFNQVLNKLEHVLPMLNAYQKYINSNQMDNRHAPGLLIMANDVEREALSTLAQNATQNKMQIAVIRNPSIGDRQKDVLDDIAALTGATIVSANSESGIKCSDVQLRHFGSCGKVQIDKRNTTILMPTRREDQVNARIDQVEADIEGNTNSYDVKKLQDRLTMLNGNSAIIYIGANSPIEMNEKMDRVDDAVRATQAAIAEGYVCGGGTILCAIGNMMVNSYGTDTENPAMLLYNAIKEPYKMISKNAGIDEDKIKVRMSKVTHPKTANVGYNIAKDILDNTVVDLLEEGIVDPAKVLRVAVEKAVSVAGTVLLTECVLLDDSSAMMGGVPFDQLMKGGPQ